MRRLNQEQSPSSSSYPPYSRCYRLSSSQHHPDYLIALWGVGPTLKVFPLRPGHAMAVTVGLLS